MTILNLQRFITMYIRDTGLRENFKASNDKSEWFVDFGMTPKEVSLASQLEVAILDVTATNMLRERIQKREAEFSEFCAVLGQCGVFDDFMVAFARQYPDGLLTREVEVQRFIDFGSKYIRENDFTDTMIELLDYSYVACELSKSSRLDPFNDISLDLDQPIYLKRPYTIKNFSCDIFKMIDNPGIRSFRDVDQIPKTNTKVLFQKDYTQPVSCTVFEIDDETLFSFLQEGSTCREIIEQAPNNTVRESWETVLKTLYESESIGCVA